MFSIEEPDEPELSERAQAVLARKQDANLFKAARVRLPHMDTFLLWEYAKRSRAEWKMSVFGVLTYTLSDDKGRKHNVAVMFGARSANPNRNNWSAVFFEGTEAMYAIHTEDGGQVVSDSLSYRGKKSAFWRFMQRYFQLAGVAVLHHNFEDSWGDE
jgi:hypothetical protein